MGWIKRMSLKKALFTMTFISLLLSLILSAAVLTVCIDLRQYFAPSGLIVNPGTLQVTPLKEPAGQMILLQNVLEFLQYALPVLIFVVFSLRTASLFYKWKLKYPLEELSGGANRIIANDLDFQIRPGSPDEFGQLCEAFETMRKALLANNRQLWRQAEERKRLNAAFSHDLRNPVTVLKGSAKLARLGIQNEQIPRGQLLKHIVRLEDYTARIERYVETMSSVQRLEEIPLLRTDTTLGALFSDVKNTVDLLAVPSKKQVDLQCSDASGTLLMDTAAFLEVTENLTANAIRFAAEHISIFLSKEKDSLILSVSDDGPGFPPALIENGIQPFQKGAEEAEHFGMGLYICSLLCQKHGGFLTLKNIDSGGSVTAIFKIS